MNSIYHWHNEVMVKLEMADLKREMETIQLIQDAGLSNPGWLERAAIALGGGLIRLGERLHNRFTDPRRAYQVTSSKYAA
ncbi:MAG TPA: hypothetical protein VFY25_11090 [Anaerolineales bacterium]|nr:hypothetical protein [Anaerolineales bacterium]